MKKIFRLTVALFLFVIVANAQDRIVHQTELPMEIQHYLKMHFPNNKVIKVEEDKGYYSTSYEIKLQNDIELEFDGIVIKEIDSDTRLPNSVIMPSIIEFVAINYPNSYIKEWERNDKGTKQQVKLNNGLELEFNRIGQFIKLDD